MANLNAQRGWCGTDVAISPFMCVVLTWLLKVRCIFSPGKYKSVPWKHDVPYEKLSISIVIPLENCFSSVSPQHILRNLATRVDINFLSRSLKFFSEILQSYRIPNSVLYRAAISSHCWLWRTSENRLLIRVIDFYEQTPFTAGCWFYSPP